MPPPPAPPALEPVPSAMSSAPASSSSSSPSVATPSATPEPPKLATRAIALPGSPGAVSMDIIAFDPVAKRVWVPAGNTGKVDVIDTESGKLTEVTGWKTVEREMRGQKRLVGPSSVAIGEGVAYVANRADNKVCIVDGQTLKIGACVALTTTADCLQYVKATKELWVTTPKDSTMTILDVATRAALKVKATVKLEGEPEGTAVDEARGIFYTNLENKDRTLAIDIKSRKVLSTWKPECGEAGPRGIAFDAQKRWLIVACTTRVLTMDAAADGKILSTLDTGAGVDMFDYAPAKRLVFVAAGKAATLTVAKIDDLGALTAVSTTATSPGTRVVVIDDRARAYVADSAGGRILVVEPPAP
jgi:DNA-binding beta-propeller fold protein YncE